jgi:ParB-like chromosome segregation protein Spo0J
MNLDDSARTKGDCLQIINGRHRWQALRELGHKTVDVMIWDIDDRDADILLATINRLRGSDVLEKKLALLSRLNHKMPARDLAKLLPQTAKQIDRLAQMRCDGFAQVKPAKSVFANPLVFFLNDKQQEIVENALSLAGEGRNERTKAAKNAAALTRIALCLIEASR